MAQELRNKNVGGWIADGYLGNGFSAVVLSAKRGGKRAALKVIDPEMIERFGVKRQLARIVREKRLEGHMHPNLVHIMDGGQCKQTGYLFVAMELLEPLTLGDVRDKLPPNRIGRVIGQLASAARFLEENDLVHRDIKPENTNIASDYSNVKLLDLGVVHPPRGHSDPSAGTENHFVGTARYSPPEFLYRQEENSVKGWRSVTFYQLGATLYDLITRTQIFDEYREPPARLYEAIKDHVPLIAPYSDDVQPWLVDLARRCLTKDWRIREQLVTWKQFEGPPKVAVSSDEIRTKIRARIAKEGNIGSARSDNATVVPTRRTLIDLFRSISTTIREVCHKGQVFPPIELRSHYGKDSCTIKLQTGPYSQGGLLGLLEIEFVLVPLDAGGINVSVMGSTYLLPSTGDADVSSGKKCEQLFVGSVVSMEFRELVDLYVHAALERALGAGEPIADNLHLQPNWR